MASPGYLAALLPSSSALYEAGQEPSTLESFRTPYGTFQQRRLIPILLSSFFTTASRFDPTHETQNPGFPICSAIRPTPTCGVSFYAPFLCCMYVCPHQPFRTASLLTLPNSTSPASALQYTVFCSFGNPIQRSRGLMGTGKFSFGHRIFETSVLIPRYKNKSWQ